MTHWANYERIGSKLIKTRQLRNFRNKRRGQVLRISMIQMTYMWLMWKDMLIQSIDKHAPLKSKRTGNRKSPWITEHLRREKHKRDVL